MSLLLWPGSAGRGREALRKSHLPSAPFRDQESGRVCFSDYPACPKKAARTEQFLLGDVAAGEGGAWLPGGSSPAPLGSSLGLPLFLPCQVAWCAPGQALLCKQQLCRKL